MPAAALPITTPSAELLGHWSGPSSISIRAGQSGWRPRVESKSRSTGPEHAFRLLNYGLSLRGLEALPAPYQLVESGSAEPPLISVLIPVQNH